MTRTVEELIRELSKFRLDAICYAYEGEVCGIIINGEDRKTGGRESQGIIYCGEGHVDDEETQVPDALRRDVASNDTGVDDAWQNT